jgi:hypothetical protein
MARILERFNVGPGELADRLGAEQRLVEELLARPERAPLVMLDGEDAQALRDDVTEQGLRGAAAVLRDADWAGDGPPTLRFFRPPGFNLESTVHDLYTLLWSLAEGTPGGPPPLDGIVFPKLEHPEEVDLLYGLLDTAERGLGWREGQIRVAFLVESGWAAAQLPRSRSTPLPDSVDSSSASPTTPRTSAARDRHRAPAGRVGPAEIVNAQGPSACPPSTG